MPGAEFAARVIEILAKVEIRATWEYPGHLLVHVPGSNDLAYGFDGTTWYGHRVTEDGGGFPLADTTDASAPRELGSRCHAIEVASAISRWYQALLPPCEHGLAWNLHCPDGCPDVDAHGNVHFSRAKDGPPPPQARKIGPSAYVDVRTTFRVLVHMRPPKKGECGWAVDRDASPEAALMDVLAGRDTVDVGEFGFGWIADHDHPAYEPDGSRNITVTVEERDVAAQEMVLL